jgi:regulator of nucleoside diphosphate kinase
MACAGELLALASLLKECLVEVLSFERTLTELDHLRLSNLVRRDRRSDASRSPALAIEHVLDGCEIVPSRRAPPDVVTMYSQVVLRDMGSGLRTKLTVCYPPDAEPAAGFVSVLSPVGVGLLGRRVGSVARWLTPSGAEQAAEIVAILFQPEASGDYAM